MRTASTVGLVAIAICVGLSACSSSSSTAISPTPTATPPPSASAASVERWAGLVAEQQVSLDEWNADWSANSCSGLAAANLRCNLYLLSGSYVAQTAYLSIWGPSQANSANYLGEVPDEIVDLYFETVSELEIANAAGKAWQESGCNANGGADGCTDLAIALERGLDAAVKKLAAWSPYL